MTIISIDGSTKATGYAVFTDEKLVESGVFTSASNDLFNRIHFMVNKIGEIIDKYSPTCIYIEEVLPEDVQNNQNTFKALIYLQAFLTDLAHQKKIEYKLIVASHWRSLCGIRTGAGVKRDSLKAQTIRLVESALGKKVTDDEADAICIGYSQIIENKQTPKATITLKDFVSFE